MFLRVEQLAAYARYLVHDEGSVRGIERVQRFVEGGRSVRIGADGEAMILSDQRVYGIAGLYTAAGRASGLLPEGTLGVTDAARDFVEQAYAPALEQRWQRIADLAAKGGEVKARRDDPVLKAFAEALSPDLHGEEIAFYGSVLRDAANAPVEDRVAAECQATVARLTTERFDGPPAIERPTFQTLADAAEERDARLAARLREIDRLEALLGPAELAFELVTARHDQEPATVGQELADAWGAEGLPLDADFDGLAPRIEESAGSSELRDHLSHADAALRCGDYEALVEGLLAWNGTVMNRRGSAPWVRRGDNGRLDVRFRGTEPTLPTGDDLAAYARNTYFLGSLGRIAWQIARGKA